jgi:N4-(beta-N-acetylglucosaminyl)-L-asparaginase
MGIEEVGMESLITDHAREVWLKAQKIGHDTIGSVALDKTGKMVNACSTSGANMKIPGRVGDTPLIGSGFYVDSNIGGAAATGMGEDIMRTCCSFRCVEMMRAGMSPQEAAEYVVRTGHESIVSRGYASDCIAVVCMNNKGEVGAAANHKGFYYAYANENTEPTVVEVIPVIDKDEGGAFFDGVAGYEK